MKKLLLSLFLASSCSQVFAQWTKLMEYPGVDIFDIYNRGTKLIAVGTRFSDFQPYIFKSNDYGNTWDSTVFSPAGRFFKTIVFKDADTGFISGYSSKTIWIETTDGGTTWNYKGDEAFNTGIQDMMFLNDKIGFACGYGTQQFTNGNSYYTLDGGKNWFYKHNFPNTPLDSITLGTIQFLDVQTGYGIKGGALGGGAHQLLKTTDTGINWTIAYTHPVHIGGIYFWNVNNGILVDINGGIYKTSNGGSTWTKKQAPPVSNLSAVAFIDNMKGFVVGTFGAVLKTVDGGETWTKENAPAGNYVRLRIFNGVAYAVGFDGVIVASAPVTGIKEPEFKELVNIYPNPATDVIYVSTVNSAYKSIKATLIDITGKQVRCASTEKALLSISTADLAAGTYFVEVAAARHRSIEKIIINR